MNTDEIRLVLWPWGPGLPSSVEAVRNAEHPVDLATMANNVIAGKMPGCNEILWAFAACGIKMPVGSLYQLAKRFPECPALGWALCCRVDATASMLDEWAENSTVALELAWHPNTSQKTIDRMARNVTPGDGVYERLVIRGPWKVLEALALAHDDIQLYLRLAGLTSNPALLGKLAACPHADVRTLIVRNRATSTAILNKRAVREQDAKVLVAIVRRLTSKRILEQVAERLCDLKSPELARAVLKHRRASDLAKTVAALVITA